MTLPVWLYQGTSGFYFILSLDFDVHASREIEAH